MAWTEIVEEDNRRFNNELLTYNSALILFAELRSESKFYELEPAEVLFVYNDPTDKAFPNLDGVPDLSFLGGVRARMIYSEQGSHIDECYDFKPINPHFTSYPVIGELVVCVSYGEKEDRDSKFYSTILNFDGTPSNNDRFEASTGGIKDTLTSPNITTPNKDTDARNQGYYYRDGHSPKLIPNEGDVVIEGRFGNSIRLGSNQLNDNSTLSSTIHISTGRNGRLEDIDDKTESTILLTNNAPSNFQPAFSSQVENFADLSESEILINSNQIIINSKEKGNIGILSSGNISIGAIGDTVIEIPEEGNIKLGSKDASEPVVKGDKLVEYLGAFVGAVNRFSLVKTPADLAGLAAALKAEIATLPNLNNLKSEKVKTI